MSRNLTVYSKVEQHRCEFKVFDIIYYKVAIMLRLYLDYTYMHAKYRMELSEWRSKIQILNVV